MTFILTFPVIFWLQARQEFCCSVLADFSACATPCPIIPMCPLGLTLSSLRLFCQTAMHLCKCEIFFCSILIFLCKVVTVTHRVKFSTRTKVTSLVICLAHLLVRLCLSLKLFCFILILCGQCLVIRLTLRCKDILFHGRRWCQIRAYSIPTER